MFLFKEIHKKNTLWGIPEDFFNLLRRLQKSIIIIQLKVQSSKTLADRKVLQNYRLQQNLLLDR